MKCNHSYCKQIDIGKCALAPPTCERCNRLAVGTCQWGRGMIVMIKWCCQEHNTGQGFVDIKDTNYDRIRREHGTA